MEDNRTSLWNVNTVFSFRFIFVYECLIDDIVKFTNHSFAIALNRLSLQGTLRRDRIPSDSIYPFHFTRDSCHSRFMPFVSNVNAVDGLFETRGLKNTWHIHLRSFVWQLMILEVKELPITVEQQVKYMLMFPMAALCRWLVHNAFIFERLGIVAEAEQSAFRKWFFSHLHHKGLHAMKGKCEKFYFKAQFCLQ